VAAPPPAPQPEISVVIPTYNEEASLGRTLESISDQTIPRAMYEIIVVDGDSTDRTREIAAARADTVLIQKSSGVGGARNDGAAAARGRIVVFTDADVRAPRDWLQNILSLFGEGVVAVCGPDSPIEGALKYRVLYFFINLFSSVTYRLGLVGTRGTNTSVLKTSFCEAGGYTDYPLCDDVELGFRMKKLGKVVYSRKIGVKMSARRFEKQGVWSVLKVWLKGDLSLLRGKRTEGEYARQSY